jgi:hypothetical protein
VGPRVLNPHNIDWLALDTATHYLGWAFYRQDVHLHWPITFTNRVGYPIGDSIAFFDLNPLLAVLLKPLSPLLPVPFQYLGIEILLQLTLQLFFALRLCSLLWNAQFGPVLFSSLFFLFAPIETARIAMSHGALSNQWLLLAALYLLVWANHVSPLPLRSFAARTTLLAAIAVGINPYLAFQVLVVRFTALAIFLWQRRLKPVYAGVSRWDCYSHRCCPPGFLDSSFPAVADTPAAVTAATRSTCSVPSILAFSALFSSAIGFPTPVLGRLKVTVI